MKAFRWAFILSVILLSVSACYWTPPGGASGLTITVQVRDLPDGYTGTFLRARLYDPDDIVVYASASQTIELYGYPVSLGRLDYFDQPASDKQAPLPSGTFSIPDIPVGTYRLRLTVYEAAGGGALPTETTFEGVSDPFEITAGGTAAVDVAISNSSVIDYTGYGGQVF